MMSKTKKSSLNIRRLSSEIISSATSKQKKDLSHISLKMSQIHKELIKYQKEGMFTEFMRDVCKLNKIKLLNFCNILSVKVVPSQSYKEICDEIIKTRPDLFIPENRNTWKKWGLSIVMILTVLAVYSKFRVNWFTNYGSLKNIALFSGLSGIQGILNDKIFLHYKKKDLQIAFAIQFLRDNPDLLKVSKQISRKYSRSHSKTKRHRRS